MLDRDPQSFPSPLHTPVSVPGQAPPGLPKRPSWDRQQTWAEDGGRARPGWFKGQSVGYMFVQFLKGRRAPCTS